MPFLTPVYRAAVRHESTAWLKCSLAAMRRDYPCWQAQGWHAYRPRGIAIVRAELRRRAASPSGGEG